MTDMITQSITETGVLTICMNRPDVLNSLNRPIVEALIDAFNAASVNDDVRSVILTGSGRGFCAGADLANGQWPREKGWSAGQVTYNSMGRDIALRLSGSLKVRVAIGPSISRFKSSNSIIFSPARL